MLLYNPPRSELFCCIIRPRFLLLKQLPIGPILHVRL